jgi:hypothetical protein
MKWIWSIVLLALLTTNTTAELKIISGGQCVDGKCMLIFQDPMYQIQYIEIPTPYYPPTYTHQSEIRLVEGGRCTNAGCVLILRNPFYEVVQTPTNATVCPSINITIYSPEEGATYYNNNVLLNFTTTGATTCYYKTSGSWNNISCQYEDTRTFTGGEVTLIVRAENGICSSEESVTFTVYEHATGGVFYEDILVFIPLFGLLLLFLFDRRKNKKDIKKY